MKTALEILASAGWFCFFRQWIIAGRLAKRLRVAEETASLAAAISRETVNAALRLERLNKSGRAILWLLIIWLLDGLVYLWKKGGFKFK